MAPASSQTRPSDLIEELPSDQTARVSIYHMVALTVPICRRSPRSGLAVEAAGEQFPTQHTSLA